jgi:hypothetical protein
MAVPNEIRELVERFERNREAYRSAHYKETQLRREFIDPLFIALGWDVENRQGYAEAYKDVVHEDALKVGGATKAPDYCFRIGGTRKFFVETKKPAVSIKSDVDPAYQLRRYAWSAKLPLSILTDFEEFAVYDCRIKPSPGDKASVARTIYVEYGDYAKRWDEIASIFARDAVLKGSFDKYAEKKRKRGTAEVDAAFLKDIEAWREELARGIALRNPALTTRELNFAVQRTIDRIIFLRICEDRGIEEHGRLMALLNGTQVYKRLFRLFQEADERYNSGLFQFQKEKGRAEGPDELTPALEIDDKLLKTIIKGLYYPDSPYEFSVLPADILGQVYEQFLGKVIRLTKGHQAKVEDKPEVKKAGGVYYTPTYIVDYIVKNTVGKLLEGSTPAKAAKLRILDPACGSGSFLIGAYQYLLDWHRKYYEDHDPASWAKKRPARVFEGAARPEQGRRAGEWRLTTAERKRILLGNIYGVDIDPQAVEVTKLSLLLKVLEGQSRDALDAQLRWTHERALPDLGSNVKCGNSLIGPDFYEGKQMPLLDDEERYRINVFDWRKEFADIMRAGGFDAVIGNPPYIFGEYHDAKAKQYFRSTFAVAQDQYDTYWLFIEKGLQLTRDHGHFSLIVPDALLARDVAAKVRNQLLLHGLERIYHCGVVFESAVSAVVFNVNKGEPPGEISSEIREGTRAVLQHVCRRRRFESDPNYRFLIHASDNEARLLERLSSGCGTLAQVVSISRGEEIGKKDVLPKGATPILVGDDISRYRFRQPSRFVRAIAKDRALYGAPKIIIVKTGVQCIAALDTVGHVTMQSVYNVHVTDADLRPEALLGILNSRLTQFFIDKTFTAYKLLFPQLNQTTVESIPTPPALGDHQGPLIEMVRRMLAVHDKLGQAKTAHDSELLQREIDGIDHQIDQLVYELYGLTDEEIGIVEAGTR